MNRKLNASVSSNQVKFFSFCRARLTNELNLHWDCFRDRRPPTPKKALEKIVYTLTGILENEVKRHLQMAKQKKISTPIDWPQFS